MTRAQLTRRHRSTGLHTSSVLEFDAGQVFRVLSQEQHERADALADRVCAMTDRIRQRCC